VNKERRTEITIETEEYLTVRRPAIFAWCLKCQDVARMLTMDQAALRAGVSWRTIYRCVEEDRIHYIETAEGLLLICRNSLA
jgi:hypothetical protein